MEINKELIMIDFKTGPFPSPQEYRIALHAIEDDLTPNQMLLLLHHYDAPNHIATAKQLAQSVGFKSSNLQYGLLASRLCEALGKTVNNDKVYILLSTDAPKIKGTDRQLTMRSEVVQAIKELKWR